MLPVRDRPLGTPGTLRPLAVLVVVVLMAVVLAVAAPPAVADDPGEPVAFYGEAADADGTLAPEGTFVVAAVDGEAVDQIIVGEDGVYAGDGPTDAKLRTHTGAGETVTFHVGSVDGPQAAETHAIDDEGVFELDLTFPAGTFEAEPGGGSGGGGGGGGASSGDDEDESDAGGERITVEASFEENDDGGDGENPVQSASVSVNATADSTVDIDLTGGGSGTTNGSDGDGSGQIGPGANVEGIEIDVTEDVAADLEIHQSGGPPSEGAQELELDDGTEPAGYLQIDHNLEDSQIKQARIDFRMTAEQLEAADAAPEDVVLYHYDEEADEWEELPTEVVEETDGVVRFRAVTDSFSEFAVGVKRAQFEIVNIAADAQTLAIGDRLQVEVAVSNTGGAKGSVELELRIDGEAVDRTSLTVAPDETRTSSFEYEFAEPGTYDVDVNDVSVDDIRVEPAADDPGAGDGTEDDATSGESGPSGWLPGLSTNEAIVAFLVVVIVLAVTVWRRQ